MSDFGLGKIIDSIGGALHIFDFSFFISGSVTLAIVIFDAVAHLGSSWLNSYFDLPTWIIVLTLLIAIYVCGLISWMIGHAIRGRSMIEDEGANREEGSAHDDFEKTYDRVIQCIDTAHLEQLSLANKNDIYSYMWIKLESLPSNRNVSSHLAYCRRLWVMRALFEGLLFSWLLAIVVLFDVTIFEKNFLNLDIMHIVLLLLLFIISAHFSGISARDYARNQLKDTIIAYKIFCLNQ